MTIEESEESWEASSALLRPKSGEIVQVSPEEKAEVLAIQQELDEIIRGTVERQDWLEVGWVRVGMIVDRVRQKKYWIDMGFQKYGDFLEDIALRVRRERSFLYQCKGIAEKLLPLVSAENLTEMGISKATELRKLLTATGSLPQDAIDRALDKNTKWTDMRANVQTILNPAGDQPGKWYDFGGCYFTDEEKLAYEAAYNMTLNDPDYPVRNDLTGHVQKKEVMLRWAAEAVAGYRGGPR